MKRETLSPLQVLLFLCLLTFLSGSGVAQDRGTWQSVSTTAASITGDVSFGNETIKIGFATFPIAQIRPLTAAEAVALFNAEPSAAGKGYVYRVSIPAAQKFLHKNTLCGVEETEWMVNYVSGRTLQLAFFSGQKIPALSAEALANTTALCGTYSYGR